MKKKFLVVLTVLLVLATFVFSGCAVTESEQQEEVTGNYTINIKSVNSTNYSSLADVVAGVQDSVVEINTATTSGTSAGSGVFYAEDGTYSYILTCHHVIEGATAISVKLTNGSTHTAQVVGGHYESDIAVLRITGTQGIVYAEMRNYSAANSALRVGESVIVIGNPLGTLGGSVTSGIVSALKREVSVEGIAMTLIQTDAAINKGNSGGAMFDFSGALIGIVNAKTSGTGIEGLGFAIPIEDAHSIALALLTNSGNASPYGGFGFVPGSYLVGITASDANNTIGKCAYVSAVHSDSFFSGKLRSGDYVTSITDSNNVTTTITSAKELADYFKNRQINDTFTVNVSRLVFTTKTDRQETVTVKQYVYGYSA